MSPSVNDLSQGKPIERGTIFVLHHEGRRSLNTGVPPEHWIKRGETLMTRMPFDPSTQDTVFVSTQDFRESRWLCPTQDLFRELKPPGSQTQYGRGLERG